MVAIRLKSNTNSLSKYITLEKVKNSKRLDVAFTSTPPSKAQIVPEERVSVVLSERELDVFLHHKKIVQDLDIKKNLEAHIPSFVKKSTKDLVSKKTCKTSLSCKRKKISSTISISFTLVKIASFFQENPNLIYPFPLYEEYIAKHNLSEEQYPVEVFLADISEGVTSCVEF